MHVHFLLKVDNITDGNRYAHSITQHYKTTEKEMDKFLPNLEVLRKLMSVQNLPRSRVCHEGSEPHQGHCRDLLNHSFTFSIFGM